MLIKLVNLVKRIYMPVTPVAIPFKTLSTPVSFFVQLRKDEFVEARVLAFYDNSFKVEFSDGFLDIFSFWDEAPNDGDGLLTVLDGAKQQPAGRYAYVLQNDLKALSNISGKEEIHSFSYEFEEEVCTVVVRSRPYADTPGYSVYVKGDYHFGLVQEEGHLVPEKRLTMEYFPGPINEDLLLEVISRVRHDNQSKN